MQAGEILIYILIATNLLVSYKGLKDNAFFNRYKFDIDGILVHKEYDRMITSGFLHVSWTHLLFNMISLYFFAPSLVEIVGIGYFILLYFAALVGGDSFALLAHREHGDYSSAGASGAICGVIFACVALDPGISIGMFFLPIFLPGWLYALIFVGTSIYGIRSGRDNIGHEAHLGGAVVGMLVAICIFPQAIISNYLPITIVLVPTIILIYIILHKPHLLLVDNMFFKKHDKFYNIDHRDNAKKASRQKELDVLLEKIHKKGMQGLSASEKRKLEELSK
ncbi:MAG: rhomboid family intramembrane serine protease [Flavobacterium sp.]|uniref:rhomboid family protein n=1 Tax=Flavobacterium sp. TaxID=239 RepID=UPI0012163E7F|nr:rhomboid family intramembrane serine protease [Flavobacterium sp.]RZJ66231.1 MAG: rhomboid family intramembrane serine protease [Flavobacterium sp.]